MAEQVRTTHEVRYSRIVCCLECRRPLDACLREPCETMAPARATLQRFEQSLQSEARPMSIWAYMDRLRAFVASEERGG